MGSDCTANVASGQRDTLEARILEYHGVSLAGVLAEIEYLRDDGDSVIAGGSLAYGLGNQLSDLDLLVVGATKAESSLVPLGHFLGSLRVDVVKLAKPLIDDAFASAEQELAEEQALQARPGDFDRETALRLLHHTAFGLVLDGEGTRKGDSGKRRRVASRRLVREYTERMRTSALLAQLSLAAGRSIAATVNARLMVEDALNAVLASRGLPFSGDKWWFEGLVSQAPDLAGRHEPFRQLPVDPKPKAAAFTEGALATCTSTWGLDLRVETLVPLAGWRNTDLRLLAVGDDRMLLSPDLGSLWQLNDGEVQAWDRLASFTAGEAGATWPLASCDEETMRLCLTLYENGLLDLHWTRGLSKAHLAQPA